MSFLKIATTVYNIMSLRVRVFRVVDIVDGDGMQEEHLVLVVVIE